MANYYCEMDELFPMSPAATSTARQMAELLRSLADTDEGEEGANLECVRPGDADAPDRVLAAVFELLEGLDPAEPERIRAFVSDLSFRDTGIGYESDVADPEFLVSFLQTVMELCPQDTLPVYRLEWACRSVPSRPGGYGGGAAVFTADHDEWLVTETWAEERERALRGSSRPAMPSAA